MSNGLDPDNSNRSTGARMLARGGSLGVAIGAGMGVAMHDIAIGAGIGLALGAAVGFLIDRKREMKSTNKNAA